MKSLYQIFNTISRTYKIMQVRVEFQIYRTRTKPTLEYPILLELLLILIIVDRKDLSLLVRIFSKLSLVISPTHTIDFKKSHIKIRLLRLKWINIKSFINPFLCQIMLCIISKCFTKKNKSKEKVI